MFRKISVALSAIAAIGTAASTPAFAAQKFDGSRYVIVGHVSPGSKVMLNPQPLPPGSKVMLNPQPLPPRIGTVRGY